MVINNNVFKLFYRLVIVISNKMNLEKISEEELGELVVKSRESPRKRAMKTFHEDSYKGPQVCLNVIQPESYIRPHFRYQDESIIHHSGKLISICFDENGDLIKKNDLNKKSPYLFLPKQTYQTVIALEPDSALWMIVQGPHDPNKFKKDLKVAPKENEDYKEYFEWLKRLI